jgi:DNA-binding NarL/FixJ family response regulator
MRVLIIDDSASFLRAARAFVLTQPGVEEVATAPSGESGLDLLQRSPADLVLVDLAMPGIDGLETTRRLKARADAPAVFVVSLVAGPNYAAAAAAAGADGFISKADLPAMFAPAAARFGGAHVG